MQIICGGDCENASKSNNRPKSERKVSHDQENNKASKIDYRDVCVPHKINGIKIQQIRWISINWNYQDKVVEIDWFSLWMIHKSTSLIFIEANAPI